MFCRAVIAAVAVTYLICVLVLSGMQKEDLDVNLLRKLQRHNVNADDINSDKVRQECRLNSSDELSILNARKNNEKNSTIQNVTTTAKTNVDVLNNTDHNNNSTTEAIKGVLKDRLNETKVNNPYEVEPTKDHNIKTRSSTNDATSTQPVKQFSEAMAFFGDQKNLDNVMNMLQTFLIAKLVENNNTGILKGLTTTTTTTPPTKPIEITTESINKDADLIKVLATFVFNKPVPVQAQFNPDEEKNSIVSKLLNNILTRSAMADRPDKYNYDDRTTDSYSDQEYLSYKSNTAETVSSTDDDYKTSAQKNLEEMMNKFRTKYNRNPKHKAEYENEESSQSDNFYVPFLKDTVTRNKDRQRQFDDFEYSKLDAIVKPEKSNVDETAKSLHPEVIKEIADTVKNLILRDLKKEILPSSTTVSSTVTTTHKVTTAITQKPEKNHIQQATQAIEKFVELLERLKSAKEFIVSPVKDDSSKEGHKNSELHVEVKDEKTNYKQMLPESKPVPVKLNDYNKMNDNMPNVGNEYKMPGNNQPVEYHQSYPIVSYLDNQPNKMVPPLMNNPYGFQQPGGRAIINVPQGSPLNNKQHTINIITPLNHTPVININQMRPAPIMIQTSKEIPPLGIPVSLPSTLNQNIVLPTQMPFLSALNETERQRWEYILKYGRNPDNRNDITDRKDKLSQFTNFKSTPNKEDSDKKTAFSLSNFSFVNKRDRLPDNTKISLPTLNIREEDKICDRKVSDSHLLNTRERGRTNNKSTPPVNKQEPNRLINFKNYHVPTLNVREPNRTSGSKTINTLDKQERDKMNKLNDLLLSDTKAKHLYKDRYKTDEEYPSLAIRQPLTPRMPEIFLKHDHYDRPNIYSQDFREASANYPYMDPAANRDDNKFINREPYPLLTNPKKDQLSKQIPDIRGFHEKLERGDYYERREPVNVWYEHPNLWHVNPNANNYDETDYSKTRIESRQQLPLTGATRMSKFDDTHFKNFLKTQQKVNDMLERILATKTKPELSISVETT